MDELIKLVNQTNRFIVKNKHQNRMFCISSVRKEEFQDDSGNELYLFMETTIFPQLDSLIQQPNLRTAFTALKYIRKFCTLDSEIVPYKLILNSGIVHHIIFFLGTTYSPSFQANSIWIINNLLPQIEKNDQELIKESVVALVKLINLTPDPAICTLSLQCINNILCLNESWITPILDTKIVTVILSLFNKEDDILFLTIVLQFLSTYTSFCQNNNNLFSSVIIILPLFRWILSLTSNEDISDIQDIQHQSLLQLYNLISYFQEPLQLEIITKQAVIHQIVDSLAKLPLKDVIIVLEIIRLLTQFGISEDDVNYIKPMIPVMSLLLKHCMYSIKEENDKNNVNGEERSNSDISETELMKQSCQMSKELYDYHIILYRILSLLEQFVIYNDLLVESFLASGIYSTLSLYIEDPFFSLDSIASQYTVTITTYSICNAQEQNLYYLAESGLMTVLAWKLATLTSVLHQIVSNDDNETEQIKPSHRRQTAAQQLINDALVNKDEVINSIASSLIDTVVDWIIHTKDEKEKIINTAVTNMIDIFIDSKEGKNERSLEDDLIIKEVTDEIIDGVVDTVCQDPPERIVVENDVLEDVASLCELLIMSINLFIMKGQQMVRSQYAKYNKYLRQLSTFTDIQYILDNIVVPSSVVFTWNRISLVLKGAVYDSLNWNDINGCDVNDQEVTVYKEDINHITIISNHDNDNTSLHLVKSFSLKSKPVNNCYIITTLTDDDTNDFDISDSDSHENTCLTSSLSFLPKDGMFPISYVPSTNTAILPTINEDNCATPNTGRLAISFADMSPSSGTEEATYYRSTNATGFINTSGATPYIAGVKRNNDGVTPPISDMRKVTCSGIGSPVQSIMTRSGANIGSPIHTKVPRGITASMSALSERNVRLNLMDSANIESSGSIDTSTLTRLRLPSSSNLPKSP